MKVSIWRACHALLLVGSLTVFAVVPSVSAQNTGLAPGVRGLATRAPKNMKIDGDLSEFKDAFCTPIEYFSFDTKTLRNRAGQFFYMWDEEDLLRRLADTG